jgi:methylisocitrate lyase
MPGVHNGLAARQAQQAGFDALYLSGAAMSATLGLPDLGMLTVDDVGFFIRQAVRASRLPTLVDGDTGFGETLNLMNMVRAFEEFGAAAVQIEDQRSPKKCGHLDDKRLVDANEMAAKIHAARRARRQLLIVARTDAIASEGLDAAVARARLYRSAGADIIFPEAMTDIGMLRRVAIELVDIPLLANMTEFGRTPQLTASELQSLGYKVVIYPVSALRVAAKAQREAYEAIRRDGGTQNLLSRMQTRDELYATIRYSEFEDLAVSNTPSDT